MSIFSVKPRMLLIIMFLVIFVSALFYGNAAADSQTAQDPQRSLNPANNYKFSNLVHFFVLKDNAENSREEKNTLGTRWIEKRSTAIKEFLQINICDKIKEYTITHFKKLYVTNAEPTAHQMYITLRSVYKEKVMYGLKSDVEWPPLIRKERQRKRAKHRTRKIRSARNFIQ